MQTWNKPFILFLILISFGLIYLLSSVLTPFLIGALLAYLVNPLVNKLMQFKITRLLSVIIVFVLLFVLIFLIILLLIPSIQSQIDSLTELLPNIITWFSDTVFPWATQLIGSQEFINVETLKSAFVNQWSKAGVLVTQFFNTLLRSGMVLATWALNLIIIPVVTFYLLRDWKALLKGIRDLLPRKIEPTVVQLTKECDSVLSAFFRGQLLVMLSLGFIYAIGLTLVGLKVGILLGLIFGLISIVPYLGTIVGITVASIAAFVQFGTFMSVFLVWIVFTVGQLSESMLLTPNLIGDRIGLHPIAVIFSVLAGGSLFGFVGVLLALPVAACLMVWLRFLHQRYRESHLYR